MTQTALGTRGTSGTYLLVEEISKTNSVLVISPQSGKNQPSHVAHKTHVKETAISNIGSMEGIIEIKKHIDAFQPEIVYMFNSHNNFNVLFYLSAVFPTIRWVLDIKTPLLAEGEQRKKIRRTHFMLQFYIDTIFTLERSSAKSWIPFLTRKTISYPLGIDVSAFRTTKPSNNPRYCTKFIFAGSIHKFRKLEFLLEGFNHLTKSHPNLNCTLDIFGSGPAETEIRNLVCKYDLSDVVRLRGLLNQKKLFIEMSQYDAGIAYVPYEKYNKSPSLKALEYAAAGIAVIASDTDGHKQQMSKGLAFTLFANNHESFIQCIVKSATKGISANQIISNIKNIHQYDMRSISRTHIIPRLVRLSKTS